jgi:hypothetical protein
MHTPLHDERKTVAARKDPIKQLEQDVGNLKVRVATLESERPGRKPRPLIAPKQRDVCAIEPDSDSTVCPYASIYRYQAGCWGTLCRLKQHDAYERRKDNRAAKKTVVKKAPVKKAVAVAKVPTKKVTKKAAPAKRVSKRVAKAS